jgi:hypothetical protein
MPQSVSKQSLPITTVNVPEPISVTGEFIYHFYMPTEDKEYNVTPTSPFTASAYSPDGMGLSMVAANNAKLIEQAERGSISNRIPRMMKVQISQNTAGVVSYDPEVPITFDTSRNYYTGRNSDLYHLIKAGNYNTEGKVGNDYHAAVTLQDSDAKSRNQQMIYRISTAKVQNGSILGTTSTSDIAAQLDAMTSDDVDATSIINMLSDDSPLGVSYVNDVSSATRNPLDSKAAIRYEMKFNGAAYSGVLNPLMVANPFLANFKSDNLHGAYTPNNSIIASIPKNPLNEMQNFVTTPPSSPEDVQPSVVLLDPSQLTSTTDRHWMPASPDDLATHAGKPQIAHIGYLLEKSGTSSTGEYESFADSVMLNPNETEFLDPKVKYGWTYTYRARQLFFITHWIRVSPHSEHSWNGVDYYSRAQYKLVSYVVASRSPNPLTISAREKTPPPSPGILHCSFIYEKGNGIRLEWQLPPDKTRDVKKYQVFRRKTINEPFECIAEYDFRDEGYTQFKESEIISPELVYKCSHPRYYHKDYDFQRDSEYIYCIAAIDAHGLSSQLGTQMKAKFDVFTNKLTVKKISALGAPKAYPNMMIEPQQNDTMEANRLIEHVAKDSNHHTMRIYFNPTTYQYEKDDGSDVPDPEASSSLINAVLPKSKGTYKFQIVNLDRQKTKILEISVEPEESLSGIL